MAFQYRRVNTWVCQICETQLSQDVYPCNICSKMEEEIEEKNQSYLICKKCTYFNSKNAMRCQVCDVQLLQTNPKIQQKHLHLICPKCHKQNNIQNTQCVYCDQQLFESQKKICPICESKVKQHLFDNHYSSCLTSRALLQEEQLQRTQQLKKQEELSLKILKNQQNKSKEECIYCRVKLFPHQINEHTKKCRETAMLAFKFDPSTRMTELQTQAIRHMHLKSQKQHNQSKPALQQRVKKLGYTIQDLNNLQFYVQNYAPIIIHIHVSKHMEFFVKDTHYRSQFQTNKSSGSLSRQSRTSWEDRMFDKKYSKAKDFQRVKYGVINFTNDPKGVGACVSYGQSYFLLKPHVRQRCTFTDKDSSNADASIATFKYCFRILSKMNDNQLKAAFNASKAQQISSKCVATYKQMQIHGPIQFGKDIERIYVNKNEVKANKNLLEMVYDFSKKFNVEHDFI